MAMGSSEKKIKISFILPTLGVGGAERVMSFLAQKLDKSKFETTLVVVGLKSKQGFTVSDTNIVFLNKPRVLSAIPALINYLRKNEVDIAFSAIRHLNTIMGLLSVFFRKTKFVGREVNVVSVLKTYQDDKQPYPAFLSRWGYALLDAIVCQSQDMMTDVLKEQPNLEKKSIVINNPITDNFKVKDQAPASNDYHKFITVGSLEVRKGHARVLKGLATLKIPFRYTIIGDGSQKTAIEELISELSLEDKCVHIPYTKEVPKYLRENHIFLQGSYVEGFPNALLESCAIGTPVIAFNAPGGINEIVSDNVNGFVVNTEEELATAIGHIIASDAFTPQTVSESVFRKYGAPIILSEYEGLFSRLAYT